MRKINKEFAAAWDHIFNNLTPLQQDGVIKAPDGRDGALLGAHAERLVEARRAARGKCAGAERQLMERLEMENPLDE